LAFDQCGVNAAASIKHHSQRGELLSDVGKNQQKINQRNIFTARLDKLGFIEAPFLTDPFRSFLPASRSFSGRNTLELFRYRWYNYVSIRQDDCEKQVFDPAVSGISDGNEPMRDQAFGAV
jgi:hypothetical protein